MAAGILFPRDAREGLAGQEMTSPTLDENVRGQRDSGSDGEDVHGAHKSNLPPNPFMGKRWIGGLLQPRRGWGCAYARAERRAGAGGELIACFAGTKTHRV